MKKRIEQRATELHTVWEYRILRSDRRTVALQIKDGALFVRAPRYMTEQAIEAFVQSHADWIEKHMGRAWAAEAVEPLDENTLDALVTEAKRVIPERVAYYADRLGVTYGRVTVRRQRTRWGSCSAQGNLNFNVLLMLAPPEVLDAIVVHELCHRKHMNHSRAFYDEIISVYPAYHAHNAWLKQNGALLMARLPRKNERL